MNGEKVDREARLGWWPYIVAAIIWGMLMFAYGRWQYHRGFDTGADAAICAFAIGMDGTAAVDKYDACKKIRNRDYVVDGFDPHGKSKQEHGA